jgi:hypothetical protein
MPMNPTLLGQQIITAVQYASDVPLLDDTSKAIYNAIAAAVIAHIQTNAQIPPGIPVATAGSPTAQTGATTGPGTIT